LLEGESTVALGLYGAGDVGSHDLAVMESRLGEVAGELRGALQWDNTLPGIERSGTDG